MPQFATDYYGPNAALRAALSEHEDTWQMIHREATGNDRVVEMTTGTLLHLHPDVAIDTAVEGVEFKLTGGIGFVPLTFTGLTSPRGYTLLIDDEPVHQSIHGNDFWQTDYNPTTKRWSCTYNISIDSAKLRTLRFSAEH